MANSPFRRTLGTGLGAGSPVTGAKGTSGGSPFKSTLQRGQAPAGISLARGTLGMKGNGPGGNTSGRPPGPSGKTLNVNPSSGQPTQTGVGGNLGRR